MLVSELLFKYSLYNQWAHKRLLELINTLSEEQQHETIPSSFDSLYKTVLHVWSAESLWLGRLNLSPIKITGDPFNKSMEKLSVGLEVVDQHWVDWFAAKEDFQLTKEIQYTNLAGQSFHQPYDLLLTHLFNHSTYHNGQLVTMLRALSLDKIPSTDFIAWVRINE